jgi:hypothetical protein
MGRRFVATQSTPRALAEASGKRVNALVEDRLTKIER